MRVDGEKVWGGNKGLGWLVKNNWAGFLAFSMAVQGGGACSFDPFLYHT